MSRLIRDQAQASLQVATDSALPGGLPLIKVTALAEFGVAIRVTTRAGGVSQGGYATANLATHVGDCPQAVAENRRRLATSLGSDPLWLNQVHGVTIWDGDRQTPFAPSRGATHARSGSPLAPPFEADSPPTADGAVTATPQRWLALLTADCVPVVLAATDCRRVAVAHAGWRGLAAGVLEAAAAAVGAPFAAWIGPAICGRCYEVDQPVIAALARRNPLPTGTVRQSSRPNHFLVDLPAVAAARLFQCGAVAVVQSGWCTREAPETWYSHRQEGPNTGRFATLAALWPP